MAWTVDGLAFNTRKELTIDSTLIDADLDNLVVEAMRTDDGDIGADPTANGGDIRFTLKVGGTLLTYERELWSVAGGLAAFVHHVEVPSVPSAADTVLYCYYNTSTGSPPDGDDGGAGNSWDANFKGVYHLNQDPSGGAPQMLDSTANNNDGTSAGSMTSGDLVDAKVGKGLDFDGADDSISLPLGGTFAALTVSAWVKWGTLQAKQVLLNDIGSDRLWLTLDQDTNDKLDIYLGGTGTPGYFHTSAAISRGVWVHVGVTYDSALGSNQGAFYINGALDTNFSTTGNVVLASPISMARREGAASEPYLGIIDEIRISNIARTPAWIKASYNSQKGSLITWGAEEVSAAGQHRSTIKWFTA